jgi:hypothetical protein
VIPAFLVVIYVTSAINAVLSVFGLPLLPNVPDPPFGPIPLAAPAVQETSKKLAPTAIAQTDPPTDDPVVPKKRDETPSTPTDTDSPAATTKKPLTNVTKDSPDFTPKRVDRERKLAGPNVDETQVDATPDVASTADEHPLRPAGKKPKSGAPAEQQEADHGRSEQSDISK